MRLIARDKNAMERILNDDDPRGTATPGPGLTPSRSSFTIEEWWRITGKYGENFGVGDEGEILLLGQSGHGLFQR